MHWVIVHDPPTGPADDEFLQDPSTASSGRKLITEIVGGSYAFFPGPLFFSSILSPLIEKLSSTPSTPSIGSHGLVVQDGKQRLRTRPLPDINFFGSDSPCRVLDGFIVEAILAKIALPVGWHLESQGHGPQVRDLTEKIHRRFGVTILQFTVGGAHAAQ